MAIAFNIPSERDTSEENFSRLNRLLAELYEVLCHILVARQPGQEAQENRRDRPYSEADAERPSVAVQQSCRLQSATAPPVAFGLETDLEDDVFVSPRTDNGNDPFSTRNLDIFGYGSPRTPAGVLLSPRRERSFTFSLTSEKQWRDKGGTALVDGNLPPADTDTDVTDAAPSEDGPAAADEPRGSSILSSIMPDKVSGSICTALLLMIGWKILSNKR